MQLLTRPYLLKPLLLAAAALVTMQACGGSDEPSEVGASEKFGLRDSCRCVRSQDCTQPYYLSGFS